MASAYETLGYIRAAARENLQEMTALVPQIQKRLAELDSQRQAAEERADHIELAKIGEESEELQDSLRLIRHHQSQDI